MEIAERLCRFLNILLKKDPQGLSLLRNFFSKFSEELRTSPLLVTDADGCASFMGLLNGFLQCTGSTHLLVVEERLGRITRFSLVRNYLEIDSALLEQAGADSYGD